MRLCLPATLCVLMLTASLATAQRPSLQQLQTQVKPGFRISPLLHYFEAPRGKLLEFEFDVESMGRTTSLEIRPVGLRQQENGVIMPDENAPLADAVQLLTPTSLELDPGETSRIRGRVRVPASNSTFHAFGILVKDLGRPIDDRAGREPGKARVGIKFVTQYLLRCDISVLGARGEAVRRLKILGGELVETQGRPQARAWIENPTADPMEFEIRCRITIPELHSRGNPFSLVLPVRANIAGPERNLAKILPGSRLRLEEFLPEAILPGAYDLEVLLYGGGRQQLAATFPVTVGEQDFPAQRAAVMPLAEQISVRPSQVELSLRRRGRRYLALTFVNNGSEDVDVRLAHQHEQATDQAPILVRPDAFTLSAHSSRKALVSVSGSQDPTANGYSKLNVEVVLPSGDVKTQTLTVALLARVEDTAKLSVGHASWDARAARPALVLPVTNLGDVHLPLHAKLMLTDARGGTVELLGGFGRWVLPGADGELRFYPPGLLPAGIYRVRAEIQIGEPHDPISVEDTLQVPVTTAPTAEHAADEL